MSEEFAARNDAEEKLGRLVEVTREVSIQAEGRHEHEQR